MPKKMYPFEGREVSGDQVDFEMLGPLKYNYFVLPDGTRFKITTVLSKVARLDVQDPKGQPTYTYEMQHLVTVDIP